MGCLNRTKKVLWIDFLKSYSVLLALQLAASCFQLKFMRFAVTLCFVSCQKDQFLLAAARPRQTKTKDVDWSLQIGRPTFFAYFAGCINGLCSSDAVASKKPPPAPWSSLGLASPGSDFDLRPIEAEKNEVVLIVDETLDTYTSPKPATLADGPIEAETVQSATVVVEPLVIAPHVLLMKAGTWQNSGPCF